MTKPKRTIPQDRPLSYREQAIMTIMATLNQMFRDKNWIEFFRLSRMGPMQVSGTREIMMEFDNTWKTEGDDDRISLRLVIEDTPDDYTTAFTFKRPPRCTYVTQEDIKLDIYWEKPGEQLNKAELMALAIMFTKIFPDKVDQVMSSEELEMKYLELNGGYHPTYTVEMWQAAVAGNFTRDGYWDWVKQQFDHQ